MAFSKIRGVNIWAYFQRYQFPGQTDETDIVFVFKMSEVGPSSGVDLARRMQPSGGLEHAWIMSDHVKRIAKWTTMACHVYDGTYQCVMTITCCDFQSEDKDAQAFSGTTSTTSCFGMEFPSHTSWRIVCKPIGAL